MTYKVELENGEQVVLLEQDGKSIRVEVDRTFFAEHSKAIQQGNVEAVLPKAATDAAKLLAAKQALADIAGDDQTVARLAMEYLAEQVIATPEFKTWLTTRVGR